MPADKNLSIATGFEPKSLIGKRFQHGGRMFELASIVGAGMEGIVYEARNAETGESKNVLKVFRSKLSEEEFEKKQSTYRECEEIFGELFLGAEFFRIGDWPVYLQKKIEGAVQVHAGSLAAESKQFRDEDSINEIIDLCNARDFAKAAQKCDEALEDFPLKPYYLLLKGIALFGMGESTAANEALSLCFEVDPDNTEHYVAVIQGCAALGQFIWGRRWAEEGAKRAVDKRQVYKAWFMAEEQAERVELARWCLEQLRLLEEPELSLRELRMRLQGLEERLARCEREVQDAWRLLQQGRLGEAKRISHKLNQEHPYHLPALFFSGVLAMEQDQLAEAIRYLHHALILSPMGNPDVPFLLGHAYLKLGNVHHAIMTHFLWQKVYNEAAAALQGRDLRAPDGAGADAELQFESAWEEQIVENATVVEQQGRGILSAYRAVADADPETSEQIAQVVQGTERLLAWLLGASASSPREEPS
jgi:tetratricopeptide (TPR) repeat protein